MYYMCCWRLPLEGTREPSDLIELLDLHYANDRHGDTFHVILWRKKKVSVRQLMTGGQNTLSAPSPLCLSNILLAVHGRSALGIVSICIRRFPHWLLKNGHRLIWQCACANDTSCRFLVIADFVYSLVFKPFPQCCLYNAPTVHVHIASCLHVRLISEDGRNQLTRRTQDTQGSHHIHANL